MKKKISLVCFYITGYYFFIFFFLWAITFYSPFLYPQSLLTCTCWSVQDVTLFSFFSFIFLRNVKALKFYLHGKLTSWHAKVL